MLQTGSVSQTDGWINQSVDDLVFAYYSNCFHTTRLIHVILFYVR